MKVFIKYPIQIETENAFLINNCWISKKFVTIENNKIIIPQWLADRNCFKYKLVYNIPEKIEPVYNQEVLDELRY